MVVPVSNSGIVRDQVCINPIIMSVTNGWLYRYLIQGSFVTKFAYPQHDTHMFEQMPRVSDDPNYDGV